MHSKSGPRYNPYVLLPRDGNTKHGFTRCPRCTLSLSLNHEPPPYFREHRLLAHLHVSAFSRFLWSMRLSIFQPRYIVLATLSTFVLVFRANQGNLRCYPFPEDTADYYLFSRKESGNRGIGGNVNVKANYDTVAVEITIKTNNWHLIVFYTITFLNIYINLI